MSRREISKESETETKRAPLSPELVRSRLKKFGAEIPDPLADEIIAYVDLLVRWNQKISLTSITDPLLLVERHFGESFFGAITLGINSGNLLDVGSGAGFPALPIAMLCPGVKETLLEPNGKKAAFLSEICRRMGLSGRVEVIRCRLEEFPPAGKFTFITSRAVRVTERFLRQCAQLLAPNGRLVLWVGQNEVRAATENSGWIWNVPVKIPGSEQRHVISGAVKSI
ncbi:MAG TPA: 16S rRNA (guanine(527)-N(7))-methyltransferase RsmG [Patescibacteria group bacterium]|nr:16S rRNA (guanine(527)-N(7))-methyltransferase RsmG [Patescibacteria group bacterium]